MGTDEDTGKNFDHRKAWVEEELALVCSTFAIDCCAYAVMSNHLHTVLHVVVERATAWSDDEVSKRAETLWPMTVSQLKQTGQWESRQAEYRQRLTSLSWFMRLLNERIARRANREDGVKGRFWEGRFKSRPLLDEGALLTCMAYVDLNPLRAGLADSLSGSEFTSIATRLAEVRQELAEKAVLDAATKKKRDEKEAATALRASQGDRSKVSAKVPLMGFASVKAPTTEESLYSKKEGGVSKLESGNLDATTLPMVFEDYVELVRFTGQAIRADKTAGSLPPHLGLLLTGAGLDGRQWLRAVRDFPGERFAALGECHLIRENAQRAGKRHGHGIGWAKSAYVAAA